MDPTDFSNVNVALEKLWNFQIAEAEADLAPRASNHCLYGLCYSQASFIRAVISESKTDAKTAFDRLKATHHLAKTSFSKNPSDIAEELMLRVVLAETDLFDAALKFKMKHEIQGTIKFRKAWKYYSAASSKLEKLPESSPFYNDLKSLIDAGVGFFHFIVSVVPKEWMWAIDLIGFKGDREKGLEELNSAAAHNGLGTPIAFLHLVWIHAFFLEDANMADHWLKKSLEKYPTSAPMHYLAGYMYRKIGKMDESDMHFLNCQMFGAQVPQITGLAEYEIGYNCYLNNEWQKTIEFTEPLLNEKYGSAAPDGYKTFGTFQLGICHHMLGNKDKALEYMKSCRQGVRKNYDYDAFADKRAKKYIANGGFTEFETNIIKSQLLYESRKYAKAIEHLNSYKASVGDETAQHLTLSGLCHLGLKDYVSAQVSFQTALTIKTKSDEASAVQPNCLVGIAEILLEQGDVANATKNLKKVKEMTNYDFCQLMQWKCSKLLDSVKAK